jgi:hypothetical protein
MNKNDHRVAEYTETPSHGGQQKTWHFVNGYGASVIRHQYSYGANKGLWEVALLKGDDLYYIRENANMTVFDDVVGYLNDPEVDNLLQMIANWDKDQY